jgi:hypothetical protein
MPKLKMISTATALLAAAIIAPATAHADGYRYARGPYVYGEFGAPYPYYSKKQHRALERAERNVRRAYERADRAARRQQERERRAHHKLMRAYDRYYSRYGYPYETAPYGFVYRYGRDG